MLTLTTASDAPATDAPCGTLWYPQAAERWFEALPIGNGRLGGMVYGGGDVERIRLSGARRVPAHAAHTVANAASSSFISGVKPVS